MFAIGGQVALAAAYRFFAARPGSVFALTAWYEPFGLAPLEAAAAGLPVVVTQNGGPSESFREGSVEYGVLVNPGDPADIARGLLRLMAATTWQQFAWAGQQRVRARYTWERTAQGTKNNSPPSRQPPSAERPPIADPACFRPAPAEHPPLDELRQLFCPGFNSKKRENAEKCTLCELGAPAINLFVRFRRWSGKRARRASTAPRLGGLVAPKYSTRTVCDPAPRLTVA
jgi:hypothetical protein